MQGFAGSAKQKPIHGLPSVGVTILYTPTNLVCVCARLPSYTALLHPPSRLRPPESSRKIQMHLGDHFVDGPIFMKSGVTLSGSWIAESPQFSFLSVYEGSSNSNTGETGIIVIDGATDAEVRKGAAGSGV